MLKILYNDPDVLLPRTYPPQEIVRLLHFQDLVQAVETLFDQTNPSVPHPTDENDAKVSASSNRRDAVPEDNCISPPCMYLSSLAIMWPIFPYWLLCANCLQRFYVRFMIQPSIAAVQNTSQLCHLWANQPELWREVYSRSWEPLQQSTLYDFCSLFLCSTVA